MIHRNLILTLISFVSIFANAQRTGIEYITALDSNEVIHYLTFNKNSTITIHYPIGKGVYWDAIINKPKTYLYLLRNDTIDISMTEDTCKKPINYVEKRILNSKFIIKSKNHLYDINSGYIYLDKRHADKYKYGVVAFDNELYVIKKRGNRALRKKMGLLDIDEYRTEILRGKSAIDKYGIQGINGVIEIVKK